MLKKSLRLGLIPLAAILCLSFTTANLVNAKDGKDRPEIQLTAEQKEKAKQIFSQNKESTAETRQALKEKREQLKQLMESKDPNRAQAEALCTEIGVLEGKMLLNRFDLSQQLVKEGLPPQLANRKGLSDGKGDKMGKKKGDRGDRRDRGDRGNRGDRRD